MLGRPSQGVATADDEARRLRLHAWPLLGDVLLKDLRPHHVRDMVRALRAKKSARGELMAPRTVRHVYGTLHTMLHDAVVDELISANPCVLKRGELPKKIDQDPTWRDGAVFTRDEAEQLISDSRVPSTAAFGTHSSFWAAFASARRRRSGGGTTTPRSNRSAASTWPARGTPALASWARPRPNARALCPYTRLLRRCSLPGS